MLKQFKLLMMIVALVLLSLFISPFVHANPNYVFDQAEVLSDNSEIVIGEVIANFEKTTGLNLRVATITQPENGTLLGSAKDQARTLRKGYYILIGTELKQHLNNLKPTIAISPSPSQFGQLKSSDYDHIIAAFQPEKQTNLENAIVISIDTLQAELQTKQNKQISIAILAIIAVSIILIIIIHHFRSKKKGGFSYSGNSSGGSNCSSSCGSNCGSSCGSSCGGGCGST